MREPTAPRVRMRRLTITLAAPLVALCALPGLAMAQEDDPYGDGVGEPCTSVICEGGVPDDGDDQYGEGAGGDPYGGGPVQPGDGGDGEPCTSVICEADGGAAENTSGEGTADVETDSGGSDDGGGTAGSSSSGSGGEGDEGNGGGLEASGGDVSGVSSVTLARTGLDAWVLVALAATFLAVGSTALLARRRGVRAGA